MLWVDSVKMAWVQRQSDFSMKSISVFLRSLNIQYVYAETTFVKQAFEIIIETVDRYPDESNAYEEEKTHWSFIDNEQLGCESFCNI